VLNAPMDFGKAHFVMAIVKKGIEEKQSWSRARTEVRFVCCGEWVCCEITSGIVIALSCWRLVLLALIVSLACFHRMIAYGVGF